MPEPALELRRDLTSRQVSMLALGGTIGAGLFVGSGAVVSAAGPVAIVSYLLGGVVVVLAMRMIAEMAVVHPTAGSLADWPRVAIGPWAGFMTAGSTGTRGSSSSPSRPWPAGPCCGSGSTRRWPC
jgi:L-asparagine transporter-like permease